MTYRTNAPLTPLPKTFKVSSSSHAHGFSRGYTGRGNYDKKSSQSGEVSRKSSFGQAGIRSSGGS